MPSTLLVGPANALTEDIVYALPARLVFVTSSVALETSATTGGGWVAQAGTATTGVYLSGGFVRSTAASAVVYCKA